jgi:zinc transporter ZupT
MLGALTRTPTITDLLTVLGSGGTVLGGVIGWLVRAPNWRHALENLALGATAGGVSGCLVAFLSYLGAKVAGG